MTPPIQPSNLLAVGVLPTTADRTSNESYVELGWPGLESATPTVDALGFDSSASVTGAAGPDPVGNRFAEARRAIQLVAKWTYTTRSKVAVVHFDHPFGASGVVPITDRSLKRRLDASLRNPRGPGTSTLDPCLTEIERIAAAHPDHATRATIFSDFDLTDADPADVFTRLANFPGLVHAVVLGGIVPPDLVQDNITVTPLTRQDAPGTFAAAVLRSMTATRRAARRSVLNGAGGKERLL